MLRKIEPIVDRLFQPAAPLEDGFDDDGCGLPVVEWGDPCDLYVDDRYQRPVTDRGRALIKKIAGGKFSWRKYCLPIVTLNPDGVRVVVDGQHTLIAAATRGLKRVPWLLVPSVSVADEADAFVGINKSRSAITAMVEHRARVTAGDMDALAVERVCVAAGVNLCLVQTRGWKPGDTIALAGIRRLVHAYGQAGARRVLDILVKAQVAPITADQIKAVESLLFSAEFKGLVNEEKLVAALTGEAGVRTEREAVVFAATHRVRKWQGLTTKLFQQAGRRRAAA
jgi:hypothetical protein